MNALSGVLPTPAAPSFAAPQPGVSLIGPIYDPMQAREWALVLQSQSIAFVMRPSPAGIFISVGDERYAGALRAIEIYEEENENWPPPPPDVGPLHPASIIVPLAFVALVWFFSAVTGPVASRSAWFSAGRADAAQLFTEPWRMVTALTLHADGKHVFGNALSGGLFGAAVSRRLGPGAGLLSIVAAGALGNAFNAFHHLPGGHLSIGASTAVFAAVGLLAAVQTVIDFGRPRHDRKPILNFLGPVVGGLALLGTLGASPDSDVWAHGYGFLAGLLIGVPAGFFARVGHERRAAKTPEGEATPDADSGSPQQLLMFASAAALVLGSWWLAMG